MSLETPEHCTKSITESCRLHPVDCKNCLNGKTCQMRPIMQAHLDVIKRCQFYRAKQRL